MSQINLYVSTLQWFTLLIECCAIFSSDGSLSIFDVLIKKFCSDSFIIQKYLLKPCHASNKSMSLMRAFTSSSLCDTSSLYCIKKAWTLVSVMLVLHFDYYTFFMPVFYVLDLRFLTSHNISINAMKMNCG